MKNTAQATTIITDLDTIKSLMELEDIIDRTFEIFDKYKKFLVDKDIRQKLDELLNAQVKHLAFHQVLMDRLTIASTNTKYACLEYHKSVVNMMATCKLLISCYEESK